MTYSSAPRLSLLAAALVGVAAMPAAALAQSQDTSSITVNHAQGETVLEGVPEKVFTYDVATLDTLEAIGVEVDGVPDATMPEHLSEYAGDDVLKIGSLFEPDYELVNAEQPDVVFVAGRSSGAFEQLNQIAPAVDLSVDWTDFPGTIKARSRTLGEIFGKEDAVAGRIAAIDADMAAINDAAAHKGNALVVMVSGGRVTAYGPGSRFGWLHDDLGIDPVIEDIEAATHGEAISFEFILEANPDWLFVIDRDVAVGDSDGGAAQAVLDNDLVHQTTAWQEDQVVYLDPVNFYIVNGGLNALQQMVTQVGDAMGVEAIAD